MVTSARAAVHSVATHGRSSSEIIESAKGRPLRCRGDPGDCGVDGFVRTRLYRVRMPSGDDLDLWLRLRLEDYRSAWGEILGSMSQQQSVLSFGAAAEAVVAAAIASQWRHLAPFTFLTLLVAPLVGLLIVAIWASEAGRMFRAIQYVASIEVQVATLFRTSGPPPMQFMNWTNRSDPALTPPDEPVATLQWWLRGGSTNRMP